MTRRERLERKVEKRREWAEGRERKATAAYDAARQITDGIPLGQPILVGHHSEKRHRAALGRADSAMRQCVESSDMAKHHESRAAGLEHQLESSIFSDDPDALEALDARVAELEAARAARVAENRAARQAKRPAPWPSYSLSNLSGNIRRLRERRKSIEARQAQTAKAEAAGGTLVQLGPEGAPNRWARVTFAEHPGRAMVAALKAAGFFWGGGSWHGSAAALPEGVAS